MNKSSCKIMEKSAMKTEEMTAWEFSPEALRKALKQKGMSRSECARRTGVSYNAVTRWCEGKGKPILKNLDKLIEVLELTPIMKFSPNKLHNLLIHHQLSIEDLSILTGLSSATIRHWILGKGLPNPQSVKRICNALCINEEEIFEKQDENVKRLVFDPKKCRQLVLSRFQTIKESAKHCEINCTTLSLVCRGIEIPKIKTLAKLANALNVPIESVFTEIESVRPSHPLKEFRKRHKLTQFDLAKSLNLNKLTISSIEHGRRKKPLTHEQIDRLCQVYHCSTKDLLGENEWNEGENQNERNR